TALVVAAIVVFLWKFPRWSIEHAEDLWADCENALYVTGQGQAGDCRHDGWLVLPKLLPWTRSDARKLASNMAYDEAEDALKMAPVRQLDAAARDRAAGALIEAMHVDPPPHAVFTTSSRLRGAAADAALLERAGELDPGIDRLVALQTALRHGDATAIARI